MFLSNRGSFRPETSGAYTLRRRGRRRPKSGSAIGACAVARLAGSGGPIGDYYGSANIDALLVGEDALAGVCSLALDDRAQVVRDRRLKRVGVLPAERLGEVALRVGVHEEHPLPAMREGYPQAQGGGGFSRAALLVRYCDGSAWHGSCASFCGCPHREVRRPSRNVRWTCVSRKYWKRTGNIGVSRKTKKGEGFPKFQKSRF